MSPCLYFKDQNKKYLLVVRKDLYRGIVNPYFLELQQKYVVGEENCPYAYTQFHTHAHTMIWLRPKLREHSSLTLACKSIILLFFTRSIITLLSFSSNSQTSQCITNIFEYSNILHQILDIWIRILNFLVTNIFDIRIRPIS